MLTFTPQALRRGTRIPQLSRRGTLYTAGASRSLASFVDVGPAEVDNIKRDRFASKMAEFKEVFEKPCVDSFSAILELKRKIGNKKAKYLATMNKKPKKLPILRAKKLEDAIAYDRKQEELLHKKIAALRKTRVDYSCMAGRTPRERKERERLFKLIATNDNPEARKNALEDPDRWFPGPESPPPSDGELGLALAKELEMANLPVKWEAFMRRLQNVYERKSHDLVTKDSFVVKAWQTTPESKLTFLNVDPDRPALLKSPPHDPRPKKLPRTIINKVGAGRPIAFEYTKFPGSVFDPMRTRKVTMYVKVAALDLPRAVRTRLLELAGPDAYEEGKDLLTLKTQKKRTYRENRAFVADRLRRLLAEAWKVDLNYLPPADPGLAPHDQVEEEIKNAPLIAEQEYQNSFDSILEGAKDLSFFRLPVVPKPDATAVRVNVLLREMNALSS